MNSSWRSLSSLSKWRCLLTILIFVFARFQPITGESEEDNCDECSIKVNATIDMIRESFKSRDPLNLETNEPCKPCVFGGIVTIQSNGDVCSIKVMEGEDTCYDHRLKLIFSKVYMNCTCEFPTNPADLAKKMAEQAKNPPKDQCMETGNTMKVPMKTAEGVPDMVPTDPMAIMALKECKPSPPANPFAKPPPKTVKGGVLITYRNFKMELILRACKINKQVRTTDVILTSKESKDMEMECIHDESNKAFLEPCQCFCKFDYMEKVCTSSLKTFFPCYGDKKVNENADVLHQLVCNDLL